MHDDPFAYLADLGWPLERLQRYMSDKVPLSDVAEAVDAMMARGMTAAEIIAQDTGMADSQPDPQEPPKPSLSTISADALEQKNIPPIKWVVKDLLPTGLTVLASPPKLGKSWAALLLCLSVTVGGTFLGYDCNKCGALYLALEDSERRLKSRMKKILGPVPAPASLYFTTTAPTLSEGLTDALDAHLKKHPDTTLIAIDTLQKVRDIGSGKDVYGRDYGDVGALKKFADIHNVCVLIIHHLRKMGDDSDVFNRISGTNGIAGASDSMWVLAKERREDENAVLSVTGRDIEQNELVLTFDKSSCMWKNLGNADDFTAQQARQEYADNPLVRTVKRLLEQNEARSWSGTASELMTAGKYITRTFLAPSTKALAKAINEMERPMLAYDGILHTTTGNGNAGKKHHFSYQNDEAEFIELNDEEQAEMPFPAM